MPNTISGVFLYHSRVRVLTRSDFRQKIDGFNSYWYFVRTPKGENYWVYGAYLGLYPDHITG
jgi:hypothetical protein